MILSYHIYYHVYVYIYVCYKDITSMRTGSCAPIDMSYISVTLKEFSQITAYRNVKHCFCLFLAHLVMSASPSLFIELVTHLISELKTRKNHLDVRTFIQCIGAIW